MLKPHSVIVYGRICLVKEKERYKGEKKPNKRGDDKRPADGKWED